MCGLVGMAGDFLLKHKDMMSDLLFMDTLRGKDSTGVAVIRRDGTCEWFKTTLPGYEFIELKTYVNLLNLNDRTWIGHNRFKTVGATSRLNAHPFLIESEDGLSWELVGAHNGTLKNKSAIDKNHDFGTDSEALLTLIARVGAKEAIAQSEGAWALTWYDGVEDTVCLLRNEERPLCFIFAEDKKTLFWASEAWMIRAAAGRRDVKLDPTTYYPKPDVLYTFEVPRLGAKFEEPKAEGGIVGKKPVYDNRFSQTTYGYWVGEGNNRRWVESSTGGQSQTKKEDTSGVAAKAGSQSIIKPPFNSDEKVGYRGKPISAFEEAELRKCGCDWCGEPIQTAAHITYIGDYDLLCHKCRYDSHYGYQSMPTPTAVKVTLTVKQKDALAKLKNEVKGQVG